MSELSNLIDKMLPLERIIISKPVNKSCEYRRIVAEAKGAGYQISKYTDKQVFHENVAAEQLATALASLTEGCFRQINGFGPGIEHIVLISKDGRFTHKKKKAAGSDITKTVPASHNRKKIYLIEEGSTVPPLVDMGIFTAEGRVVTSMYDKFRQINRFLEIIDDEIKEQQLSNLNVIDFGCGKSYLTFVIYYYLTEVRGITANIVGLDLKADVIAKCNEAAKKYGYDRLHFEVGDVNGYKAPFDVDMVITLHACDTATDYALYNAINWRAKMIFSVPCCQHELNKQVSTDSFKALTRYGIVKERFCALATDAIRANLLEYSGYKTQLLEFIDFEHTPKNILIRAVRRPLPINSIKKQSLAEVESLMEEFNFSPTLYELLMK